MRAVGVAAGTHELLFHLESDSVAVGGFLSLLVLGLLAGTQVA